MKAIGLFAKSGTLSGANTDVGKTLITTALVLADSQRTQNNIYYLKCVASGLIERL